MTWSKSPVNEAPEFCLVELLISFCLPDYSPQQIPCPAHSWPPIWAHLASDIGSKRIRRQPLGKDPGLPRFPKPHYSPVIAPVIGSARASPVVSSSELCLGFYVSEGTFLHPLKCYFPDASWPPRGGPESVTLQGPLPKIKYEIPGDLGWFRWLWHLLELLSEKRRSKLKLEPLMCFVSSIAVILKVWPLDQKHEHSLRNC